MAGYGSPATPRPPLTPERRAQLFGYIAAVLGLLSFVWGFLDWFKPSGGGSGSSGYESSVAEACVGLALTVGLLAGVRAFENRPVNLDLVAIAVASLLIVFALMVSIPDGVDSAVGLILQLITAIAQAGVLIVGWLMATGRIASRPAAPTPGQWQPHPGYQPPNTGYPTPQAPPQGYQPPPPPQGYQQQPPPQGYQQPPPQQGYQQPPQS
jgi:hypothetical protein